ncbi:MAG: hypothetical protein VW338_00660 [Rhodospirillaceae bacterium]
MARVSDLFSGASVSQALYRNATLVGRPNFELQFNVLQNTIIERLNQKIAEAGADDELQNSRVDVFLANAAKKLTGVQQGIEIFIFENARNVNVVSSLSDKLDQLDTALDGGDTAAFNTVLGKLNETAGYLKVTDGSSAGIFTEDGVYKLRSRGVVRLDNAGTTAKATAYSDFADATAARQAVSAARAELGNVAAALLAKHEGAEAIRVNVSKNLNKTLLQIQAAQIADQASKAQEIAKLREEYGQLLYALSLAFESSQFLTEQLGAKLFEPPELDSGSVINIFT